MGVISFAAAFAVWFGFYLALGSLPVFLAWTKDEGHFDLTIRFLLWSSLIVVPFFIGTVFHIILVGAKNNGTRSASGVDRTHDGSEP